MKKMAAILAGAMLMIGMVTTANAFTIRISDSSSFTTYTELKDNVLNDDNSSVGTISYDGDFSGSFDFYIDATGKSASTTNLAYLKLNSFTTSGAGTLYLAISDAPFSSTTALLHNAFSTLSSTDANLSVSVSNYYGSTEFDKSNFISSLTVNGVDAAQNSTQLLPALQSPFSLTEVFTITALGSVEDAQVTGKLEVSPVPEPGTVVLLGAGLFGLGLYGRRRSKK